VADASISVGVAILILVVWIQDMKKKKENPLVDATAIPSEKVSPGEDEAK
jgi:hypothetical protein